MNNEKRQFVLDVLLYIAIILSLLFLMPELYHGAFSGSDQNPKTDIKFVYGQF